MNELLMVSDGSKARLGTVTAGREWFKPWRTITGQRLADPHMPELQVAIEGLLAPRNFLALLRDFIVFEDWGGETLSKKMAGHGETGKMPASTASSAPAEEAGTAGR